MWDVLGDISFLVEELIVAGIIGGLVLLINHFRNKGKDMEKLKKQIKELQLSSANQDKALMVIVKLIDEQSKKVHPKEHTELQGIAKEILTRVIMSNGSK